MPSGSRPVSFRFLKKMAPRGHLQKLTPEQRRMYASEELLNFRTIAKVFATRSPYVLGKADLASAELQEELSELGQFAEVAYGILDPTFVFEHLELLSKSDFPLEGYDALPGTKVICSFKGHTAELPGYVAYRTNTRQLIVAFSGTNSIHHALLDLNFRKRKHPAGKGCAVHRGFWSLYNGCKAYALDGIRKGLEDCEVEELVITGHSLGGALAFLLALDLVTVSPLEGIVLSPDIRLKVVGYGCPRVGNAKLAEVWRDALSAQREKGRVIQEYLVKAYNDGVPALPPAKFGYRHFTLSPVYFYHGKLFNVPPSECEHGTFDVEAEAGWATHAQLHPRGGHNYYNSRDLERVARRMHWISDMMEGGSEWESKYIARLQKDDRKWQAAAKNREISINESGPATRS